jgi:hypothetical protein
MHWLATSHPDAHLGPIGGREPFGSPGGTEMFYSVASPGWEPGQPLTPAGALLFRTRSEAESFAPGAPAVAVAVRFDGHLRAVRPHGAVDSATDWVWSAPAVGNTLGGVTVFGSIPASLVRPAAEVEGTAGGRIGAEDEPQAGPVEGFGGWGSMAMALLA